MTTPRAVIWDLDGTLVDSAPDLAHALNALLAENGQVGLAESHVRSMIGDGVTRLVERGFAAADQPVPSTKVQELVARFMQIYTACATNKTRLYSGVRAALQGLADLGLRQGVCTNKPAQVSRQILSELSIAEFFSVIVGGDTTAARKPDPRPVRYCLDALKVEPRECLLIGDSAVDVAAARAAAVPVGIVGFGYSRQCVSMLGADFQIDDYDDLPEILGKRGVAL